MTLGRQVKQTAEIQANGIETFESCEGGEGHAFPVPTATIRFYGTPGAGWRAVAACIAYGLPIHSNEPTGPQWEVTLRERVY